MKLNTATWGDPGAPRSAVLIHGVTSNAASWVRVGPELAAHGFYVVAPELRGHGASPRASGHYSLDEMVGDLAESVPTAPTLLVGHSFGGVMAILAVLRRILQPAFVLLEDPVLHFADQATPARLLKHDELNYPRDLAGILQANPKWLPIDAEGKRASLAGINWEDMHQVFAENAPWDLRGDLRRVAQIAPLRLVLPEESFYVPAADAAAIAADLGPAAVVHVPGTGHSIHRDDMAAFLAIIADLVDQRG
ncbi:MAG TPA: alpha/beta fold hydrolase [Roseiflexaceae bacterium]|nr:alpha/beta fold hydrolase [Roseiflexaceae bacterium]